MWGRPGSSLGREHTLTARVQVRPAAFDACVLSPDFPPIDDAEKNK